MDWSAVDPTGVSTLAVLVVATLVGKSISAETRVLTGLIVIALVVPSVGFVAAGLAWVLLAVAVKLGAQWISWL